MRLFWFAIVLLLVLGVLSGLYEEFSVTGSVVANLPPQWDYPTDDFTDGRLTLDLHDAFYDPDHDPLSFRVESSESVAAGIQGSTLIASGEGTVWVTASDGNTQVLRRIRLRN